MISNTVQRVLFRLDLKNFLFELLTSKYNNETLFVKSLAGVVCKNSGWGKINNQPIGNLPSKLQVVDLPIVARATCQEWYEGINGVYDGEVCAGTAEGGVSPCNVSFLDKFVK